MYTQLNELSQGDQGILDKWNHVKKDGESDLIKLTEQKFRRLRKRRENFIQNLEIIKNLKSITFDLLKKKI